MTNSLQIGSHLCDGCVIDASRLTGPECERTWYLASRPPGRHRYPRLPPLVLCRRPAYPPRPDGDPDDPRSPLYDALGRVPVVSSPPPNLSGAVASLSRPGTFLQVERY